MLPAPFWCSLRTLADSNHTFASPQVALQRPESARSQPLALVTPVLYTSVIAGGSGEDVARAMGYQQCVVARLLYCSGRKTGRLTSPASARRAPRTSSFVKKGVAFDFSVGLRVEVYSVTLPSSVRLPPLARCSIRRSIRWRPALAVCPLSQPPSSHLVVEVRSPPAPHSAVNQIIGHALDLKKRLVALVALDRVDG